MAPQFFDAVVIGTGFGGAVTACRLVQAGLHICVLERGRRYEKDDFPRFAAPGEGEVPDLSRFFWSAGQGLWEVRDLNGIDVGQAAGYGGGSLIYANVHLRAPRHIFDSGWPSGYSRAALDRYYDLASYMLQVAPIDQQEFGQLPRKTTVMKDVATALGRDRQFFHPPLAVHFHDPNDPQPPNGSGPRRRTQQGCRACGNCDIGCGFRAKNTLDFNYLAIAEDRWDDERQRPYADIRTLAEVTGIEPIDHPDTRYRVTYQDRLCGSRQEHVEARWVFVCAGAVNSTELLLKCKRSSLPKLSDALGQNYFANGDALGLAYDSKRDVEPARGPTITTSLLFERDGDPAGGPEWFLLQDGGYPPSLKRLFGIFRAPIWLGRNRYLERAPGHYFELARSFAELLGEESEKKAKTRIQRATELVQAAKAAARAMPRSNSGWVRALERAPGHYFELARRFAKLFGEDGEKKAKTRIQRATELVQAANAAARAMPRSSNTGWVRLLSAGYGPNGHGQRQALRFVSHASGGLATDLAIPANFDELLSGFEQYLPDQFKEILRDFWRELKGVLSKEVGLDTAEVADAVLRDLEGNRAWLHCLVKLLIRPKKLYGFTADETIRVLKKRLRLDRFNGAQLLIAFFIFLLGFEDPGDKTAVFLVMGRDDKPGRLVLEHGVLSALFRDPLGHPVYSAEERLMRDYVDQLDRPATQDGRAPGTGAQLRVNPAWSFLNRPITVHSQGGCPMADAETAGVTDGWGRVHGYPGLFVIDASVFPRSVGVNPSATILAIAERNIEHHIREHLQDQQWEAPEHQPARTWVTGKEAMLDPIGAIESGLSSHGVEAPSAEPIGFKFKEVMQGFHADAAKGRSYERAEELGRFANTSIRVVLQAEVGDLTRMVEDPKHEIALAGKIVTDNWPQPGPGATRASSVCVYNTTGSLRLLVLRRSAARERLMVYRLAFDEYVLNGFKRLRERPGSDAWRDTTTLFIAIRRRASPSCRRMGILRVGIDDFITRQMRSFEVTGTRDEERIAWAFSAFGSFFFSNLEKVYLPEIDRLRPFP